jgi:hypothetical protein
MLFEEFKNSLNESETVSPVIDITIDELYSDNSKLAKMIYTALGSKSSIKGEVDANVVEKYSITLIGKGAQEVKTEEGAPKRIKMGDKEITFSKEMKSSPAQLLKTYTGYAVTPSDTPNVEDGGVVENGCIIFVPSDRGSVTDIGKYKGKAVATNCYVLHKSKLYDTSLGNAMIFLNSGFKGTVYLDDREHMSKSTDNPAPLISEIVGGEVDDRLAPKLDTVNQYKKVK